MSSNAPKCNMSPTEIMNKIYEIVSILQTLQTLIKQLNQICLKSLFRFMFSIIFYFTPQLNPYVWANAYEDAMKYREAQARAAEEDKNQATAKTTGSETVPGKFVDGAYETRKLPSQEGNASPAL